MILIVSEKDLLSASKNKNIWNLTIDDLVMSIFRVAEKSEKVVFIKEIFLNIYFKENIFNNNIYKDLK